MNANGVVIGDPRHDGDVEAFARVDGESFGSSFEVSLAWTRRIAEHATVRVARSGDDIVGGYALLPVGQFYGGRSVPARAVVAVCVHPAQRRKGIAGILLRDLVDVAGGSGAALAPLQAATTRLYRRWGWELGDRGLTQTVRTSALAQLRGSGDVVQSPDDRSLEALRRAYLPAWDGPLDRPDWWLAVEWTLADDANEQRRIYGWSEDGRLTGYVRYRARHESTPWLAIAVEELIATTPDALRGLLGFLGALEAQAPEITFRDSAIRPRSELLYLVPDADKSMKAQSRICWMQRLVAPGLAMRMRGWPQYAAAQLHLEVSDPARPDAERFVLEVSDGEGELSPGGDGRIRCGVGVLSSWYSSTMRAREAVRLGWLEGPTADVEAMDSLLGDRDAWLPDFF